MVENAAQPAAAHLVNGSSVLIPTAFRFPFTTLDANGHVLDEITPPLEVVRGKSGEYHDTMSCTFAQTQVEEIPGGRTGHGPS